MNASRARAFSERRFAWLGEPLPEVAISFEFFPPKTADAEARLWQAVDRLAPFQPNYVSVTCGAGGNPAEGTAVLVDGLLERAGLRAAAHLTCATAPRATVDAIAERYWQSGIRHIVALRGDPPKDAALRLNGAHYPFAADLVRVLRRIGDFEISVAAYPEPHPEAASADADFANLKRKIDAAPLPSTALIPTPCCACAIAWSPPAFARRSRSASCRCTTSPRCAASANAAAPACRTGWATCSTGSTTIPSSRRWSRRVSPPSRRAV